jgi:hypothetical protein
VLVDGTGKELFRNEQDPELDLPSDLKAVLWEAGIDPASMNPEQRTAALAKYEALKRSGATTVNVNAGQKGFENTNALATQFRADTAEYQAVADSYAAVLTAARDPSPAGDLTLITSYMKMIDPTTGVKEGELANAQNAASIPERIRAQYNRVVSGQRLTPESRADFVNQARQRAAQKQAQLQPTLNRYRRRAREGGFDPSTVVFDMFEELGVDTTPRGAERLR